MNILTEINLPTLKLFRKGKVRNVYDLDKHLLIVASDRISAFDVIMPNGIPEKGKILTRVSQFWFDKIGPRYDHHLISTNVDDFPAETQPYKEILHGRSMFVRKTDLIEVECVVRGYLIGTGWKEYQQSGTVCGIALPANLRMADKLPEPIFTPAYKAMDGGHDENISFEKMQSLIGAELSENLRKISLDLYALGRDYAETRGIILADTKFEFGRIGDQLILIDEVLTPDSSRYWPKAEYQPGSSPPSFDKQIVRDYLESTPWNKHYPGPVLPEDIVKKASEKYLELERILVG
ncbi:MAG: phosphoribosylaminoimidazolesuccinocarboxamide synthase [Candidatus Margulisbacteria bacterium]|nr:phosphoribosylaminoimidazolesuccinocarboxamide synthase [Candidatus Margulisiibacteriota bacterium]